MTHMGNSDTDLRYFFRLFFSFKKNLKFAETFLGEIPVVKQTIYKPSCRRAAGWVQLRTRAWSGACVRVYPAISVLLVKQ